MPALIIRYGKHRGQKLVLPDVEIMIGRDESCKIRLTSSDVSRQHCAIRPSPEGIFVRDLGSRNGTLINDVVIEEETLLKPGDVLRVGPMAFQMPGEKDLQEQPQAAGSEPGETQPTTDDAIANWLTGDEPGEHPIGPGDTTIVPNKPPAEPAAEPKPTRVPPKKEFTSIADEAADIIRRHWESVDEQEQKKKRQ